MDISLLVMFLFVGYMYNKATTQGKDEDTHSMILRCMQEIDLLKSKVNEQQEKLKDQQIKMNDQQMQIDNQQNRLKDQQRKMDVQQRSIEELKSKIRKMEKEDLQHEKSNLDSSYQASNGFLASRSRFSKPVNSREIYEGSFIRRNVMSEERKRRLLLTPSAAVPVSWNAVGFHALLSAIEPKPSKHHTLVFDLVKTDTSHSYSRFTGIFTVPVQGLYVFTTSIYTDGQLSLDISVNDEVVSTVFPDSTTRGMWTSATGTAVVNVQAGDNVFVRTRPDNTPVGNIVSAKNVAATSFSGWKLN